MTIVSARAVIGVVCIAAAAAFVPAVIYKQATQLLAVQIEEWEHGFKTDRVIATRYKVLPHQIDDPSPALPYSYYISFQFPQDPDNADRAEITQFMSTRSCGVMEMGGRPWAPVIVICGDVTDKESANRKLAKMLPALDQLMLDMRSGRI